MTCTGVVKGVAPPTQDCRYSQSGAMTARPRVVTASVRPRTLSAGSPIATMTAAPTTPVTTSNSITLHPECPAQRAVR